MYSNLLKVKIYSVNTTDGVRYGLKNAKSGDILIYAWSKWKTIKGVENYVKKMGYELVH